MSTSWREIIAQSLDWDQAHVTLHDALKGLTKETRSLCPDGYPHSVWDIVDHIRITQHDLLDFCRNPHYKHDLAWPADYWPRHRHPSDAEWHTCLEDIRTDRTAFAQFTIDGVPDLTATIPHGTGQTYLRTILLEVDHGAYHLGQVIDVRRLNGDWNPEK